MPKKRRSILKSRLKRKIKPISNEERMKINKLFILELLNFILYKRQITMLDSNITLSLSEFRDFVRKERFRYVGAEHEITADGLREALEYCSSLNVRDQKLNVPIPRINLLAFSSGGAENLYEVSGCITGDIKNSILYLETLLGLRIPGKTILYLDRNGDLWVEPKEEHCYSMIENGNPHRIIDYLASNNGFVQTPTIAREVEMPIQGTRTLIDQMRKRIERDLDVDGNDVIEGKKGSGYRIGPKFKIQKNT